VRTNAFAPESFAQEYLRQGDRSSEGAFMSSPSTHGPAQNPSLERARKARRSVHGR